VTTGAASSSVWFDDGFGSEDDIRRESEFLFRCYSDPFAGGFSGGRESIADLRFDSGTYYWQNCCHCS
jgi:hypothetical protein